VSESALIVVRRLVELFNRTFGQGRFEVDDEARALYTEEPVIVPFRAALEGTRYEGPGALEEFARESGEIWAWVRIEEASAREIDERRALVIGTLTGVGKESGAQVSTPAAWVVEVEGERIVAVRSFSSEREALAAVGR
jgi:hypothetical protein